MKKYIKALENKIIKQDPNFQPLKDCAESDLTQYIFALEEILIDTRNELIVDVLKKHGL